MSFTHSFIMLYLYFMGWLLAIALIEPHIRAVNVWLQTLVFALWPIVPPICVLMYLYEWYKEWRAGPCGK